MSFYPHYYQIERPTFLYDDHGLKSHLDRLRGLLTHQPLKPSNHQKPRCLFVFREDDRELANTLYLALRNGEKAFPGCSKLVGIHLEKNQVSSVRIPVTHGGNEGAVYLHHIKNFLENNPPAPELVILIHDKGDEDDHPYLPCKAYLASKGIPSQHITRELMKNQTTFKWAIANIALAILVKLGGIPWKVQISRNAPSYIIGVGRKEVPTKNPSKPDERTTFYGFTTSILSDGLFQDVRFLDPTSTEHDYYNALKLGVISAIEGALEKGENPAHLTIHVTQQSGRRAVETVRSAINQFKMKMSLAPSFEIVRISDSSDFEVYNPSFDDNVPAEGTVVGISPKRALLLTEGRGEKETWRGRVPIVLDVTREYFDSTARSFDETLEEIFHLSAVNWRGFNAVSTPTSIYYSKLISNLIGHIHALDPKLLSDLKKAVELNSIPWFI